VKQGFNPDIEPDPRPGIPTYADVVLTIRFRCPKIASVFVTEAAVKASLANLPGYVRQSLEKSYCRDGFLIRECEETFEPRRRTRKGGA
jgi:hypothetical protein